VTLLITEFQVHDQPSNIPVLNGSQNMVRVDFICGYLVSPEQLRAQVIRYDPGGDLALLHSGVRLWAEGYKLPIPHLWEVQYPRLVLLTEGGPRI